MTLRRKRAQVAQPVVSPSAAAEYPPVPVEDPPVARVPHRPAVPLRQAPVETAEAPSRAQPLHPGPVRRRRMGARRALQGTRICSRLLLAIDGASSRLLYVPSIRTSPASTTVGWPRRTWSIHHVVSWRTSRSKSVLPTGHPRRFTAPWAFRGPTPCSARPSIRICSAVSTRPHLEPVEDAGSRSRRARIADGDPCRLVAADDPARRRGQ